MRNFVSGATIRAQSFAEILDDLQFSHTDARDARRFADAARSDWLFAMLDREIAPEPDRCDFEAGFFSDEEVNADKLDEKDLDRSIFSQGDFDKDSKANAAEAQSDADFSFSDAALSEDEVAAELALKSVCSIKDLACARRAFALRNHPDRVRPALRAKATVRMQLANMLLERRRKEIEAGR